MAYFYSSIKVIHTYFHSLLKNNISLSAYLLKSLCIRELRSAEFVETKT